MRLKRLAKGKLDLCSEPAPIGVFRAWGRMAEQFERLWDGPLAELYEVISNNFRRSNIFLPGYIMIHLPL